MDKKIVDNFGSHNGFGKYKPTAILLLKETIKILNEFDIEYFLISGTLLGYVRHNDFIPWDDDIDLIVDIDILTKLPDICKKYGNELTFLKHYEYIVKTCFKDKEIQINKNNRWYQHLINKNNQYNWPFIDLFTFRYSDDKKQIVFFNKTWNYDDFFPASIVNFVELTVAVPKNPMVFLIENYGTNCLTVLKSNNFSHKTEQRISKIITITMDEYKKYFN